LSLDFCTLFHYITADVCDDVCDNISTDRNMKQNRTTIKDIARILKIHNTTVSRALRNHPDVNPQTRDKIQALAKKLNYQPNVLAQSLKTNKSYTIGLVVPEIANPFFAHVVHSIITEASKANYKTIVTVSLENSETEKENIQTLISMRVDGLLICIAHNTTDTALFHSLKKQGIKLVFYDRSIDHKDFSRVTVDDYEASFHAVEYAIRCGYDKIAHLAGFIDIPIGRQRALGYKNALEKFNVATQPGWFISNCTTEKDGYNGFMTLMKQDVKPDLIFTFNCFVAQGVYQAARETGIRIPQDMGVIGFGNKEFSDLLNPPLTFVRQDPEALGRQAVHLLIEQIEMPGMPAPRHIILATDLKVNASCQSHRGK